MHIMSVVFPKSGGLQIKTTTDIKSAGVNYDLRHSTPKTESLRTWFASSAVLMSVILDMPDIGYSRYRNIGRKLSMFDDDENTKDLYRHGISLTGMIFSEKEGIDYVQFVGSLYVNFLNISVEIKTPPLPIFAGLIDASDFEKYEGYPTVFQYDFKRESTLPHLSLLLKKIVTQIKFLASEIVLKDYTRELTKGTLFDEDFEFEGSSEQTYLANLTKIYMDDIISIVCKLYGFNRSLVWLHNLAASEEDSWRNYHIVPSIVMDGGLFTELESFDGSHDDMVDAYRFVYNGLRKEVREQLHNIAPVFFDKVTAKTVAGTTTVMVSNNDASEEL